MSTTDSRVWESMSDVPSDVTVVDADGDLWFGADVGYAAYDAEDDAFGPFTEVIA